MRIATRYAVRAMMITDIPQVLEVERDSFPTMWPPTAFKRELQQNQLARYVVAVEHNPPASVPVQAPAEPLKRGGAFERLFGEVRHLLGGAEDRRLAQPKE